ncbi:MAG TPA: hypothetical protein VKQ34_00635 [Candidatus Saccharimonadales bacterium]|nr:hypothetical protein [Candidatus Saccharimonadales bacterium]
MAPEHGQTFVLPVLVFGVVEVRRLRREIEALEDFMNQSKLREPGKQPALPRLSRLCEGLAQVNHLNLLQPDHRQALAVFLQQLEAGAPSIHISFASDPSSSFTAKLVGWLRANIHPYTLLEIGLQPTLAAGCVVRTNNKVFDLSLRERFADSEQLLLNALEAATSNAGQPAALGSAVSAPAAVGVPPQGAAA